VTNNAKFFRDIASWRSAIIGLTTLTKDAMQGAVDDIRKDIARTHDAEKDPYGRKYARRKRAYPWPILHRTGHLARSFDINVRHLDDLQAVNTAGYATFHQHGTKVMAVRLVVPTARKGLPETWRKIIVKALQKRWKQNFAKRGLKAT
jgi:phage gpG-like protein